MSILYCYPESDCDVGVDGEVIPKANCVPIGEVYRCWVYWGARSQKFFVTRGSKAMAMEALEESGGYWFVAGEVAGVLAFLKPAPKSLAANHPRFAMARNRRGDVIPRRGRTVSRAELALN